MQTLIVIVTEIVNKIHVFEHDWITCATTKEIHYISGKVNIQFCRNHFELFFILTDEPDPTSHIH